MPMATHGVQICWNGLQALLIDVFPKAASLCF
jgi:hypothetical protein